MIDPNDPSVFNFSLAELNFGNHYGALEFGMLGHMTSGAVNTPEMEVMDTMSHSGRLSYDGTSSFASSFPFNQTFQPWQTSTRQGSTSNLYALQHNGMDAFAVADTTASLAGTSPNSQNQDWNSAFQSSSAVSPEVRFVQPDETRHLESRSHRHRPAAFPPSYGLPAERTKRKTTKHIYDAVKAPYPYTQRFHNLTAFLLDRFPHEKRIRIAKALSAIRPSFIALTKDLSEDDLIFMEQAFQRQLIEYEDRWQSIGTPSIICRRTGEIVSCNKEFSLVTGWRRDVLVGKEPNLNVNFGSVSGTQTGTSSRGAVTPRIPTAEVDTSIPQPVFITEVFDHDSACEFWETFAEVGFSASASSMEGAICSINRYRTKDDPGWNPEDRLNESVKTDKHGNRIETVAVPPSSEKTIEMSHTWFVRRDIFDVPIMVVINVSVSIWILSR
jgi:PAS domain-containing protein